LRKINATILLIALVAPTLTSLFDYAACRFLQTAPAETCPCQLPTIFSASVPQSKAAPAVAAPIVAQQIAFVSPCSLGVKAAQMAIVDAAVAQPQAFCPQLVLRPWWQPPQA
jgi:hypothetical protein